MIRSELPTSLSRIEKTKKSCLSNKTKRNHKQTSGYIHERDPFIPSQSHARGIGLMGRVWTLDRSMNGQFVWPARREAQLSRRFSRFDPNRAQVRTRLFLRTRLLQIQASFSRRRGAASASASPFPRRRPRPPPPGRRAVEIVRAWIDFSVLPMLVRKP